MSGLLRGLTHDRLRVLAVSRTVWLAAVAVWLVIGATYLTAPINLAQGTSQATALRRSADPVSRTWSVCPGPETLGVEGLPRSPPRTVSVTAASAPGSALPAGLAATLASLSNGSLKITGLPSGGEPAAAVTVRGQVAGQVVRGQIVSGQISSAGSALVTGTEALAPGTVATQWSLTRTGNSRGLVTAACRPPAASSWLIAGAAAPGRLEHLVLANPGPNAVTVDLRMLGVKGRIQSDDAQGVVVAARARTVILLDAIAGSEQSPVVQVTARGGKVAAILSDSWLDGVVPRGGDDVVSTTAPALEQVIPGVLVEGRAIVRVAVPGNSEAVVESRVLTPTGPRRLPAGGVTRVAGGGTKDIDLGSLPPGAYAVQVRGDVPLVAAAVVERRRATAGPSDFAWSVASSPIRGLAGIALPASGAKGIRQRLDLVATGDSASVRVTTVGAGGRESARTVAIAADSVSMVSLAGATSVWVTPLTGGARATVATSATGVGGALLSMTPLADLPLTMTPVPLRQLRD